MLDHAVVQLVKELDTPLTVTSAIDPESNELLYTEYESIFIMACCSH